MMKLAQLLIVLLCANSANALAAKNDSQEQKQQTLLISRFAELALDCVHKEYPNIIKHQLTSKQDVQTPKQLYPAFYGCFDWHSSVHGHWLLTRILHKYPDNIYYKGIVSTLNQSFTRENINGELAYFNRANTGTSFERPYGLAWFLQLTTELRQWNSIEAKQWLAILRPLEDKILANITSWLPKLAFPIRGGEHSQTAFAFGLILDWSIEANDAAMQQLLTRKIISLYGSDNSCPLAYEPSGQDFLSPCIAEADLMRRVMNKEQYAVWLTDFLPSIPHDGSAWLVTANVVDKSDGKLAHLDGLNLSRSWMLEGIASGLDKKDPRQSSLKLAAKEHKDAGINAVVNDLHYMGSHWLGSFATYLETKRGLN